MKTGAAETQSDAARAQADAARAQADAARAQADADRAATDAELRREMLGEDSYDGAGAGPGGDVSEQMAAARSGKGATDVPTSFYGDVANDAKVFELDVMAPVAGRPSVAMPTMRPSVPSSSDEPVGRSVDMKERDDRRAPMVNSAELSAEGDELDSVMGSNRRREAMSYDWCRNPIDGFRLTFSRHYYELNVLVDRFADNGAEVAREVGVKVRALQAYNATCTTIEQRIGYLAYIVGTTPSLEDAERVRRREVVTGILAAPERRFFGPKPGVVIDMSAQNLHDLTRKRSRA